MKALFGRANRSSGGVTSTGIGSSSSTPPIPTISQPAPERKLTISATPSGLLVTPVKSSPGHAHSNSASSASGASLTVPGNEARAAAQPAAIKIAWTREAKIEQVTARNVKALAETAVEDTEIQAFGIVGILRVFNYAYLLVVTSRSHAGDFFHASLPVYRCSGVLAIPLSQSLAVPILKAEGARQAKARQDRGDESSSDDDSDDGHNDVEKDDVVTPSLLARDSFLASLDDSANTSGYAATLKPRRNESWTSGLSRREKAVSEGGPAPAERDATPGRDHSAEQATAAGQSSGPTAEVGATDNVELPSAEGADAVETDDETDEQAGMTPDEKWHEATKAELEDKLVREASKLFARGEMWFAYDLDITTSLQRKHSLVASTGKKGAVATVGLPFQEPSPLVPLWKRVDRRFWYNEALSRDFVEAGLHAYILPIMQGYFQVTKLPLPGNGGRASLEGSAASSAGGDAMDAATEAAAAEDTEATLMIISRRSKQRAGLRYQRRGINDEGQVANYTETEQIAFVRKGTQVHLLSFVQFRGSIPLFWSQSPFSMKPPPVLERSDGDNIRACARHFDEQTARYGTVTCVNLAEQHGKEGQITEAFRKRVQEDIKKGDLVKYVAFDFHKECSGMRFENVSKLLDNVHDTMDAMGYFWATKQDAAGEVAVKRQQKGAFRVNCLDCLDRTNVVQSAFGRHMLTAQLDAAEVFGSAGSAAAVRDEDFDFVFNDTWANNGDMISQAYAGTRALKGDFTRTGKRNFLGMMNDATASVYRMVQGAVTDFFRQTVIDFVRGELTLSGLERYNDQLAAQDPTESIRLARVRASAIETCASMIIGEDETHLGGWTLFSPVESNKIHGSKFEEKVVLLTNKALYSCGYDFTSEKLSEFSKILLGDITGIKKGLYIISPNEAYHPEDNWGMIVSYITDEKRLNNASVRNVPPPSKTSATNFMAFRAVRSEGNDFSVTTAPSTAQSGTVTKEQQKWWSKNSSRDRQKTAEEDEVLVLTPRQTIDRLVSMVVERCHDVGAIDESEDDFVKSETIQSLAQAKANASLFAPLLEGLKRRLWL